MTKKLVVSANFTIEPIAPSIKFFFDKLGFDYQIEFSPYNQIFQQLIDPSSLFYDNQSGANVMYLRTEDLIDLKSVNYIIGENQLGLIKKNADELATAFQNASKLKVPLIVLFCPHSERVAGQPEISAALNKIETKLLEKIENIPNLYVFQTNNLAHKYQVADYDNPTGNLLGHMPYTPEYYSALGAETVRRLDSLTRNPFKVIVLDCDNTLWSGVCGEDGVNGIKFDDAFLQLQQFAKTQSETGTVLCICSKNNEEDVWNVFDNRQEMLLKRSDIVSWRINWEHKSGNLKALAEELQLGLDSFIFIDDDPAVCAEVKMNCPEVLTVQIPKDLTKLPRILDHIWAFDKLKITAEDRGRNKSYQEQVARHKLQAGAKDLNDFLESLQLVCNITEMQPEELARVSQLSLRTNQFNSTTIRRSEAEIQKLLEDPLNKVWTIKVSDRFGDYGLVGVIFFTINKDKNSCHVDSFMLSCRALGRGVEYKILRQLAEDSKNLNLETIDIAFRPTAKNAPIVNFLEEVGVQEKTGENSDEIIYRIPVEVALNIQPAQKKLPSAPPSKTSPSLNDKPVGEINRLRPEVYFQIGNEFSTAEEIMRHLPSTARNSSELSGKGTAPQNEAERKLIDIWQKVLRIDTIGTEDNFFQIGGDSLQAVSIFVEIEKEFGKTLPLSALIVSPTVREIASLLENSGSVPAWKYLVPLRKEGAQPPLFCIHAAGGNVLFYRDLMNELSGNQPVYGIQARGIADKNETAHEQVEEMARDYIKEIKSFYPSGPYLVCGSSFGGLVAFEIASQLQAAGDKVNFLGLFDTYAPGYLKKSSNFSWQSVFKTSLKKLKSLKKQIDETQNSGGRYKFLKSKTEKLKIKLKRKMIWKQNQFALQYNKAVGKELPQDLQRNHKAIQKALQTYSPKIYDGQIHLFRASEQPADVAFDPFLGWSKYTTEPISVEEVKGTHGAVTVHPFAADLAEKLTPYLANQNEITEKAATAGF